MARRSDHTGEELTRLTLGAAEKIVRTEGLTGLSARRLAKAIGYTPGTLYNHFEDLDEIVLRLNAQSLARLTKTIESATDATLAPRDQVQALAQAYVGFAQDEPRLWEALTGFRRTKPGPPPDWFLAEAGALLALLERILDPLLPPVASEERRYETRRLWASIHGVCALAAGGSIGRALIEPVDRMVRDLVDLQCDAWEAAADQAGITKRRR